MSQRSPVCNPLANIHIERCHKKEPFSPVWRPRLGEIKQIRYKHPLYLIVAGHGIPLGDFEISRWLGLLMALTWRFEGCCLTWPQPHFTRSWSGHFSPRNCSFSTGPALEGCKAAAFHLVRGTSFSGSGEPGDQNPWEFAQILS